MFSDSGKPNKELVNRAAGDEGVRALRDFKGLPENRLKKLFQQL